MEGKATKDLLPAEMQHTNYLLGAANFMLFKIKFNVALITIPFKKDPKV